MNVQTLGFTVQVQTQDKRFNRTIILEQGRLHLKKEQSSTEDSPKEHHIQIVFDNTKEAFKLSNELRKDKHKIFTMIQDQKVMIKGDFSVIQSIFSFKELLDNS